MMSTERQMEPSEHLRSFYMERGIEENNLQAKMNVMLQGVRIPNFPYKDRKPALYELELQWFKDMGYSL